jgi:glutathione synthase/RimK-type ligase-like ATP-grasp enzyme
MPVPDPARYAKAAAERLGLHYADLDNGEGYLFRVSGDQRSVLIGAGAICSFPINSATSVAIARDKAHTASALRAAGLPVIPGALFFTHDRRIGLRGPGRERGDAVAFAEAAGYPVFCKPNTGARGNFAEIIPNPAALLDYLDRVRIDFESILIQPVIRGIEHRVLIYDGEPLFHAVKSAPYLIGDGQTALAELLIRHNRELTGSGLSAYPETVFKLAGRTPEEVAERGERVLLPGRRNLSATGDIAHFSTDAPCALALLARAASNTVGLRIAAVDIFDQSPSGDLSDLLIIEVNGNPGLRTPELAGRYDLAIDIWVRMLRERLLS